MCKKEYLEVESDGVDRDDCLAGKVLQSACEEGLWEEEPRDPEHGGDAAVYPLIDELDPGYQICHPRSQGFQTGVSLERIGMAIMY